MVKNFGETKRFYILKVHEDKTRHAPILIAVLEESKQLARDAFRKMRPKVPILNPNDYNVIDTYDLRDNVDFSRLKLHNSLGEILFMIEETAIGTWVGTECRIPVQELMCDSKKSMILHVISGKLNHKVIDKNFQAITRITNVVAEKRLTTNINNAFYTSEDGQAIVSDAVERGENIAFVIYEKTVGELIEFAKEMYTLLDGKPYIDISWYYVEGETIYEVTFGDSMELVRLK